MTPRSCSRIVAPGRPDRTRLRDWRKVKRDAWTLADAICAFIETHCPVPEGKHVGHPIVLQPFQRRFIYAVYDSEPEVETAILSVGRKNGKTALIAALMLAYVTGPLQMPNATIAVGARSREQAGRLFAYAVKIAMLSPVLKRRIKIVPSQKRLIGLVHNVELVALAAEASTAMGGSYPVVVLDELGQVEGASDPFTEALVTSQGAYESPLQIVISTQAPSDHALLSTMIDGALTGNDSRTVCHLYAAPKDCRIDDRKALRAANPGLGSIRSERDLVKLVDRARRLPALENSTRNLILNQRVEMTAPFMSRDVWEACAGPVDGSLFTDGRPVYGGLDLSGALDLTAMVLMAEDDRGVLHLKTIAWTPAVTLRERELRDKAPYPTWVEAGLIIAVPGKAIDLEVIAPQLVDLTEGMNLTLLHYDPWRINLLKQALARAGQVLPLSAYGQGFKHMTLALEAFETEALEGRLRHGGNPVLRWNMSNAVVEQDAAGNRKLAKHKSHGRIDCAVAAVMAVAALRCPVEPAVDVAAMVG